MSTQPAQATYQQTIWTEMRGRLERIPRRFSERMLRDIRRQKTNTQGGRYTAWDFAEAPFHDLKAKMK